MPSPDDFRALTHILPEACLLVEASGQVVSVNPATERLTGRSRETLEGAYLSDFVSDDPENVRRYLTAAARTREPVPGALAISGETDTICACLAGLLQPPREDHAARLFIRMQERGASVHQSEFGRDQGDRPSDDDIEGVADELERTSASLERSRALLEESQRSARVGSWEWDVRTGALTWSEELYRIYGLDPDGDAISFDQFMALVHPRDRNVVEEKIDRAMRNSEAFGFEHRIITPGGTVRILQARGRAIIGADGDVVRMIGSGQDITERKQEEERGQFLAEAGHALTSSLDYQETLRRVAELAVPRVADWAAVDVLTDGEVSRVAIAHPDPAKLALAEEAARRWPMKADDPGGSAQVQRTGVPLLLPEIPDSLLVETSRDEEHLRILRELGLESAMIVPMEAHGQIVGSITFIAAESGRSFGEDDLEFAEDLAARAALAVDNARLYKESQEASQARDDLIAIVSHDLRSPLNAVLSGASLLMDIPLPEEKRQEQYGAIKRAAQRMERLTRDLLDITRIEAGHLKIEPVPADLRSVIEEALDAATFAAGKAGISVSAEIQDQLPPGLVDRARILQVLDNLVSNAIRHTPEGGRITVAAEASDDTVQVRVADTGSGIPDELRDHIFDRYYQAESSDHGGAGLGLPIAKGIIDAHRGKIWLETAVGKGTTFFFTLPVAARRDENGGAAVA